MFLNPDYSYKYTFSKASSLLCTAYLKTEDLFDISFKKQMLL